MIYTIQMYGIDTYVPLWCKSNYSFLEGASHPDELLDEAARLGLPALALTDRDGLYGVVQAHQKARQLGLQLIIGAELTMVGGNKLILLVKDLTGYRNLCKLITLGRKDQPKGQSLLDYTQVAAAADGLFALWGTGPVWTTDKFTLARTAQLLESAFGQRLNLLIQNHKAPADQHQNRQLMDFATRHQLPTVAATEVLYHNPGRHRLQDILTCIRHNTTIYQAGTQLQANPEHALQSPAEFAMRFNQFPSAISQSNIIARCCTFTLDELNYRYPSEINTQTNETSLDRLTRLAQQGAKKRYPEGIPHTVDRQLKKELQLIDELNYTGYFLTMFDIVCFCRQNQIICQGRGSAANSVVCYCLGITAIDPVAMNLLFERFLSRERAEPPDIDLDIEHQRREEVIQFVYRKYGRERAAMVAVIIRYRPKSAVKDVGRALEIPKADLHRLSKLLSRYGSLSQKTLLEAGFTGDRPAHTHLFELAKTLVDFPRHLSIHPGGFILGADPLYELVPVENATRENRTVIQWDKNDVEAMGLFKVDLLGLGALTHLHRTFDLIKQTRSVNLDLASVPQEDTDTYRMLTSAKTVGVFQVESRAQMAMLPRLRPRTFYDLVVEVSIVRPGPITGGMVHPYLRRRSGTEPITFPHPSLEPILKKTLGVPLFQEQVMKIAMVAADYTPGEADQLRRDMGAWRKNGRILRHREKLISRMTQKGIARTFAAQIFEQIRGFGEYGFPESHAASFALISYATAYLKCHYPAEFFCALLNSLPMGFYSAATIVEEAKRSNVTVLPVHINKSQFFCTMTGPSSFRMGLRHVNGIAAEQFAKIERARAQAPFSSPADLAKRSRLTQPLLAALAKGGALQGMENNRRNAIWLATDPCHRADGLSLNSTAPAPSFNNLSFAESIIWDFTQNGHSTSGHPMSTLRPALSKSRIPTATEIRRTRHGETVNYVGMVICRQRPSTANGVVFMTLEDETGFVNIICWKTIYDHHRLLAQTATFLGVWGTLQNRNGVTHLVAQCLWQPVQNTSFNANSRDFK